MQIETLETKRSHIAKTFSKLRMKSSFLFQIENSYILRFDLVITQVIVLNLKSLNKDILYSNEEHYYS